MFITRGGMQNFVQIFRCKTSENSFLRDLSVKG